MTRRAARPLTAVLIAVAAACGDRAADSDTGSVRPDTGGTAVIALNADLDYANILVTADRYTQEILRYVLFLPLVHYDAKLDYQPALAESFQFEGDSAVTFKLRRDVYWHDGVHTTAHDVAFTIQRATDPATAFPNADWLIGWGAPQVVDSFTVRFSLQRMSDPLAGVAMLPIMPRHRLDSIPPARLQQAAFNKQPVGNGPFRFVEYRANDRWVFESNPRFPEALGRPNLRRLILRVIPDGTAQIAELRAGNVDLANAVLSEQFKALDADSVLRGIIRESRNYAFIPWNAKRPPLDDARVRRALTMAIDRNEIINLLRSGVGQPATGPIGKYHWAYNTGLQPLPYAPDQARELFAASGLRDRNGDGRLDKPDGSRWRLELMTATGSALSRSAIEMIRSDLEAVGVQVSVRPLESSVLAGNLTNPRRPFDAALVGFENDLRLNFHDMFHSSVIDGPLQFASYRNAAVDSLIDRAGAEPDRSIALPLWHRFQEILLQDQPWTFLYYFPDLYMAREELQGADMDVRGAFVNVNRWWKRTGH